jgi:solute carrier family 25 protein 39/40
MSKEKNKERLHQVFSSSGGAIVTALLMTPLDVVKVRLQSQTRQLHQVDCFVLRNGLTDQLCACFNDPKTWYNKKIPGGRYTGTIDAFVKIVRFEGFTSLWSGQLEL